MAFVITDIGYSLLVLLLEVPPTAELQLPCRSGSAVSSNSRIILNSATWAQRGLHELIFSLPYKELSENHPRFHVRNSVLGHH